MVCGKKSLIMHLTKKNHSDPHRNLSDSAIILINKKKVLRKEAFSSFQIILKRKKQYKLLTQSNHKEPNT
jgi:hypothetical protein